MTDANQAVDAAPTAATATPAPASTPPAGTDTTTGGGRELDSHERGELTTGTPTPHPGENQPPNHDAPKAEWLEHARRKGYDRADDDITLDQLRNDYGA